MNIEQKVRFFKAWQTSDNTDEVITKLADEKYMRYQRDCKKGKKGDPKDLKEKRIELARIRDDFRDKNIELKPLKAAPKEPVDDTPDLIAALKKEGLEVKMTKGKK